MSSSSLSALDVVEIKVIVDVVVVVGVGASRTVVEITKIKVLQQGALERSRDGIRFRLRSLRML